jgi:hypothetical protein
MLETPRDSCVFRRAPAATLNQRVAGSSPAWRIVLFFIVSFAMASFTFATSGPSPAPHKKRGSRRFRLGVLQNDGAGLQQGLQVGDHHRPGDGYRRDEFRGVALDGVGDGELDR